jgi:hypothetical protein
MGDQSHEIEPPDRAVSDESRRFAVGGIEPSLEADLDPGAGLVDELDELEEESA